MKAVLPNRPNGISTNPHSVVSLNSISEGEQDDNPCKQQHDDLDEILEETDVAHQPRDGVEDRASRIQSDLGDAARLEQFGGGEPGAARFEAQPGKAFEDDPGETVPVTDNIGEGTDEQG
jgi:hypothetical protein